MMDTHCAAAAWKIIRTERRKKNNKYSKQKYSDGEIIQWKTLKMCKVKLLLPFSAKPENSAIIFSKECCQQDRALASETAHENMSFNVEPRASANTHNLLHGCPESQGKTNKNRTLQKKRKKEKKKLQRSITSPGNGLLPFLKPFLINADEWGSDVHCAH